MDSVDAAQTLRLLIATHTEIVSWLKTEHGMGHGHATAVVGCGHRAGAGLGDCFTACKELVEAAERGGAAFLSLDFAPFPRHLS